MDSKHCYRYRWLVGAVLLFCSSIAFGQSKKTLESPAAWPSRMVKLVVPTAPGQASDVLARVMANHFAKAFGQPFIVENRAGAGGAIGLASVAKSAPDAYTLVIASSGPLTISPAVMATMSFDPIKDFAPIANVALTPQVILVSGTGPYTTLEQLIAAAKKKDLAFAIPPLGSTSHLAFEAFSKAAGVKFNLIPFRGNIDSATQVISGDMAAMYDTVPGSLSLVRAGKLRALAIAAPQRSPFLPTTPTLAEQGLHGAEAVGWIGLAAPAGTPPSILKRLSEQTRLMLATPEVQQTFRSLAFVPAPDTSQAAFAETIHSEISRWSKLARDAGVKIE
jgi:tripartite-type tricarboxylate transporter receptor subunit TctC